jgi:hypothetical protein
VFENKVLRRMLGSKWDGVTGEWKKLHNEELPDLYSSPNIVRVIKYRRMKGRGQVHTGFRWRNLKERDHMEDPGVEWRTGGGHL